MYTEQIVNFLIGRLEQNANQDLGWTTVESCGVTAECGSCRN